MKNSKSNSGSRDRNDSHRGSSSEQNRRLVLKSVATGAALGGGLLSGAGTAAASTDSTVDEKQIRTESLSSREKGQLRGRVFSSSAFKTIRQAIREDGYQPQMADVTGKRVLNEETNYEREVLKIPCRYRKADTEERTHGAVLFAHTDEEEVFVRCISQCEGEPIYVRECTVPITDRGAARDTDDIFMLKIPTNGGE